MTVHPAGSQLRAPSSWLNSCYPCLDYWYIVACSAFHLRFLESFVSLITLERTGMSLPESSVSDSLSVFSSSLEYSTKAFCVYDFVSHS